MKLQLKAEDNLAPLRKQFFDLVEADRNIMNLAAGRAVYSHNLPSVFQSLPKAGKDGRDHGADWEVKRECL